MYNVVMRIPLAKTGKFTLVDADDYNKLASRKWSMNGMGRVVAGHGKTFVYMHRLIMNPPKHKTVDHINGDPLDNRKSNLRVCTFKDNMKNKKLYSNNTSGFKGAYYNKRGDNYYSIISVKGKNKHLGVFKTALEAHKVYADAASKYYKQYYLVGQNS